MRQALRLLTIVKDGVDCVQIPCAGLGPGSCRTANALKSREKKASVDKCLPIPEPGPARKRRNRLELRDKCHLNSEPSPELASRHEEADCGRSERGLSVTNQRNAGRRAGPLTLPHPAPG
jgi:hypothetical protein